MPAPRGYTHVVETSGRSRTIYLAGQLGMTPDGKFAGVPGDFPRPGGASIRKREARPRRGRRNVRARRQSRRLFHRHGASADLFRSPRPLRQHRGAARFDRGADIKARARRGFIRDRGDSGSAGIKSSSPRSRGRS